MPQEGDFFCIPIFFFFIWAARLLGLPCVATALRACQFPLDMSVSSPSRRRRRAVRSYSSPPIPHFPPFLLGKWHAHRLTKRPRGAAAGYPLPSLPRALQTHLPAPTSPDRFGGAARPPPMPKIRPILPKTSISDRRGGGKNAFFVEKKRWNPS